MSDAAHCNDLQLNHTEKLASLETETINQGKNIDKIEKAVEVVERKAGHIERFVQLLNGSIAEVKTAVEENRTIMNNGLGARIAQMVSEAVQQHTKESDLQRDKLIEKRTKFIKRATAFVVFAEVSLRILNEVGVWDPIKVWLSRLIP